ELDEHRDDQNGDAEVADQVIDPVHCQKQRLGDEIEVSPVNQEVEAVEAKLLVIAIDAEDKKIDTDDADLLGASEHARAGGGARPGRDRDRIEEVVGLVSLDPSQQLKLEACVDLGGRIGDQRGGPVFVGDAEPALGGLEFAELLLFEIGIGNLLKPV